MKYSEFANERGRTECWLQHPSGFPGFPMVTTGRSNPAAQSSKANDTTLLLDQLEFAIANDIDVQLESVRTHHKRVSYDYESLLDQTSTQPAC